MHHCPWQQPSPAAREQVTGLDDAPQQACPLSQQASVLQWPAPSQWPHPLVLASYTVPCPSVRP